MSDFRIEDLFEPLNDPDEHPPTPVDTAVERYGFAEVYRTLQRIVSDEEARP